MKKVIKILILVLIVVFTILTIVNQILFKFEKNKYSVYGEYVEVDGKEMYVSVIGKGENTIVILPGSGCVGSTILYRPLAEKLSKENEVIIVELFGYGFSDDTCEERSIENITEELKCVLNKVASNEKYIFMPHSMSGLYSLNYAINYPEEVKAIIGLDMTVAQVDDNTNVDWEIFEEKTGIKREEYYDEGFYPLILNPLVKETGIMRLVNSFYNKPFYEMLENSKLYSEQELEILHVENNRYPSMALLKEYHNGMFEKNITKLQKVRFPGNLPVLDFRANMSIKISNEYLGKDIIQVLNSVITNTEIQKVSVLETNHSTIYIDSIDIIVEQTNEFLKNIK